LADLSADIVFAYTYMPTHNSILFQCWPNAKIGKILNVRTDFKT
jgi:hypothetical protein